MIEMDPKLYSKDVLEKLNSNINYIRESLPCAALYEQLAEESAELAAAASKVARILRGENPSRMETYEANQHLIEEMTDVRLCSDVVYEDYSVGMYVEKAKRWADSIKEG